MVLGGSRTLSSNQVNEYSLLGVEQSAQYEFPSIFLILSDASTAYTLFALADWLDLSTCDLARDWWKKNRQLAEYMCKNLSWYSFVLSW